MRLLISVAAALFTAPLIGDSLAEKKNLLSVQGSFEERAIEETNQKIVALSEELRKIQKEAAERAERGEDGASFKPLLIRSREVRNELEALLARWRKEVAAESKQGDVGYALWDQEEVTLAQLVADYGSQEFLYIVPPDMAGMKIHICSNIPIPRESWSTVLEAILTQSGIGAKPLNPFVKQLYILKQDLGAVEAIAGTEGDLECIPDGTRVFYLISPPIEQLKATTQFFEKFSDSKQTFVHQIGSKVALVASREEISKLVSMYNKVWQGRSGKVSRVIPLAKMNAKEMEKVITAFFSETGDRGRPPFTKGEIDSLGVFATPESNSLVLIGNKETVDRAEQVVRETEEQLQDPTEMTVFLYTCKHSDPVELAKVLEKVYQSLAYGAIAGPTKETEISASSKGPGGAPDGYPPMPALVVSPPPLHPASTSRLEIEQGSTEHFTPDPKSGTLLMTVRRDTLSKIKDLLKRLDVPKKMVEIEILLFERKLTSQNNAGMNLLRLGKARNGVQYTPNYPPEVNIQKGLDSSAKGVMQFFFHGPSHKYTPKFDIAYNFLMTQEDVQLNAAPSVVTVNQSPASITIVEERSINNGAAPVDTSKGTSYEKSFSRAQYGIIINITPTIHSSDDPEELGCVTLQTDITFDTTKSDADDRPLVDRRHIQNEVRVADGETVILGGLRRKTKQDVEEKVPFLGDIPGFGKLFGTTQLADHDTEMFFFITPKIVVNPKEQMEQIRSEELKRRPGDLPEFMEKMQEAEEARKRAFLRNSLRAFFVNDR